MAVIAESMKLGKELCQMFGVDPEHVTGIKIELSAGRVATVEIEERLFVADGETLRQILQRYKFELVGEM